LGQGSNCKGQGRLGERSNLPISQVLGPISTELGKSLYTYPGIIILGFVSAKVKVVGVKGQIHIYPTSLIGPIFTELGT
jgi:hypothetical protein